MIFEQELALVAVDEDWPKWVLVAGWLAAIWTCVWILRPLATLLHELGHAIPALIMTDDWVELRVGKSGREDEKGEVAWRKLGRLRWKCSFRGGFQGFTGYDRDSLNRWPLLAVIAGGPLFSGLACALGAWLCVEALEKTWQLVFASSFLCSNAVLFLRSAIPVLLRDGEPSDGRDFWSTLCKTEESNKGN